MNAIRMLWCIGFLAVSACVADVAEEPSTVVADEQAAAAQVDHPTSTSDQLSASAAGQVILTTYYSEPARINVVGSCAWQSCPPKGRTCTGIKTAYFINETDVCY